MSGCKTFWKSNKTRVIASTVLSITAIVFTVINLAVTAANPRTSLSWAHYSYDYPFTLCFDSSCNTRVTTTMRWVGDVGLIKSRRCVSLDNYEYLTDWNYCEQINTASVSDNNDLKQAGQGVIAANAFAMLFSTVSILILWLFVFGKADKLRVPRIIMSIANFLALLLYIVSVSTWFKLAIDKMPGQVSTFNYVAYDGSSASRSSQLTTVETGYAVAINIVVIFFEFFGWAFSAWRIWLPNKSENGNLSAGPTSPTGSNYNNFASPKNLLTPQGQMVAQAASQFYNAPATPGGGAYGDGASNGYGQSSDTYSEPSYSNRKGAYGY